jgi:hypothetical protein
MDRAEAGIRAQTGQKPEGGYYTGNERITLQKFSLGRITKLPSSIFYGSRVVRGGGGGSPGGGDGGNGSATGTGAIVVRPQVNLIDRVQDLQIQTTQQSVGFLQQSLDVINVRVVDLTNGINNLARQLQLEGSIEQKNLKDQQESERKLNERQIRLGKESLLEKKITAALARPIVNLQKNITSLFDRITGALTTLFFGWLTNQGIETLKAFAAGDTKKLEEIKNQVIKNVLYSIGAFAAIKLGFGLVMRSITGLTFRIAGMTARILTAPFRAAGAAVSRVFGGPARSVPKTPGRVPVTTSGGKVLSRGGNFFGKFFDGVKGLGKSFGAVGKGASRLIPFVNIAAAGAATAYDLSQKNYVGASLSALSAIPGPFGWAAFGGRLLYGGMTGEFGGKSQKETQPNVQPQTSSKPAESNIKPQTPAKPEEPRVRSQAPEAPQSTPSVQPQTTAAPQLSEITMRPDAMRQASGVEPTQQVSSTLDSISTYGMPEFGENKSPTQVVKPSNIQSPPKSVTPIGTLPEPKPNIIVAGGGQDRTQVAAPQQQESLTDVPFIPSGNTDNFYILYSQLNYNVVI